LFALFGCCCLLCLILLFILLGCLFINTSTRWHCHEHSHPQVIDTPTHQHTVIHTSTHRYINSHQHINTMSSPHQINQHSHADININTKVQYHLGKPKRHIGGRGDGVVVKG
jgi:hypothetical protein